MAHSKQEDMVGKRGWMRAVRHDLGAAGDVIEKTWYQGPDTEHVTCVMLGKVQVTATGEKPEVVEAGAYIDWPAGSEYEVRAIEAPARLLNIFGPNAHLVNFMRQCPDCQARHYALGEADAA